MTARVLVLGAGFGGLEVAARLSERFGTDIEVTLIDAAEHFVFGFAKLDVMFGKRTAASVSHPYRRIDKPGVRFVQTMIRSIDAAERRTVTDAGSFDADYLVIALGADLDPGATPGLVEDGHEYYTNAGAFAARDALAGFAGGRIVIGVTRALFKCPPAPSETALLTHEYLSARGLRAASEIALVMPMPAPVPPVPEASTALLEAFAERDIAWHPKRSITALDASAHEVVFADGSTMPYDLFLGVPRHVVPAVVAESGLAPDGWVPVDPLTLQTGHPDVFAIGDVAQVGTPKAGAFAEGQAVVVAEAIAARIQSRESSARYDGSGVCYVEFGGGRAGRVDVRFLAGGGASGSFVRATGALADDKDDYRASRVRRWITDG
ncbi:FAD/NAD(P)-binding oxidoreductase [Microbacterium kribbense]|uniref:FAD/NAD(P)-binding oxidoreductase n=1 Tax=Microbacterium kribbense TaxID=433645 RepID=A0ABP7G0L6_9MICO